MHPCPFQTGLETETHLDVRTSGFVTCQDVPIFVVHEDIGPGPHGIGVEYGDRLAHCKQ